jgi:protein ImuA
VRCLTASGKRETIEQIMNNSASGAPTDMSTAKLPVATISVLRQTIAPWLHPNGDERRQSLGVPAIDGVLGGGLLVGAVHELRPLCARDHGAATGFAGVLAARVSKGSSKPLLWIQHDLAAAKTGKLYGAGLDSFGISLSSLLVVQVPRAIDALWAMEEALKCRAVGVVVADIVEDGTVIDLTATRRLSLAARDGGGFGLLLRHRSASTVSAAATRWAVASVSSERDRFGGLGRTTFDLSLLRNRCGPCGRWIMSWDHHERAFVSPALSRGVAQAARDRSARALSVRAA